MTLIVHETDLTAYTPPGHSGTRNVRLVEKDFCGAFEMIKGRIAPGGAAEAHAHDAQHQVIYVLAGACDVRLGDGPAERCEPGAIIRIPPGLMHEVVSLGPEDLELIVLYSPPLPPRDDRP